MTKKGSDLINDIAAMQKTTLSAGHLTRHWSLLLNLLHYKAYFTRAHGPHWRLAIDSASVHHIDINTIYPLNSMRAHGGSEILHCTF